MIKIIRSKHAIGVKLHDVAGKIQRNKAIGIRDRQPVPLQRSWAGKEQFLQAGTNRCEWRIRKFGQDTDGTLVTFLCLTADITRFGNQKRSFLTARFFRLHRTGLKYPVFPDKSLLLSRFHRPELSIFHVKIAALSEIDFPIQPPEKTGIRQA